MFSLKKALNYMLFNIDLEITSNQKILYKFEVDST